MIQALVVDDSAVMRKVARRMFEGMQFETVEAEDGEKALVSCTVVMPDLILLDWNMPVMDGFDFVRALRRMPEGRIPKVLLCTSENDVAHIARAMHAGADGYIMKPFDRETMKGKIEELAIKSPALTCAVPVRLHEVC